MSEISINTVFFHPEETVLQLAKEIIGDYGQENVEFGYGVVNRTDIQGVVLAELLGGTTVDIDGLLATLRKLKPECLAIEVGYDDGSNADPIYIKKGRRVSKSTVINTIRKHSPEFNLFHALHTKDKKTVRKMLNDSNLNVDVSIGGIPLVYLIIEFDDIDAFKLFLNRGVDINTTLNSKVVTENRHEEAVYLYKGSSLLITAVKFIAKSVSAYLIENADNINAVDSCGDSALTLMAEDQRTHYLMVPAIRAGANPNHENSWGATPLFIAICTEVSSQQYTIDLCEKLMALGADIHHVSNNRMNARWAAHLADIHSSGKKIIKFVEAHGITDCHAPDDFYDYDTLHYRLNRTMYYNDPDSFDRMFDASRLTLKEMHSLVTRGYWGRHSRGKFIKLAIGKGMPAFVLGSQDWIKQCIEDKFTREYLMAKYAESLPEKQTLIDRYRHVAQQALEQILGLKEFSINEIDEARQYISGNSFTKTDSFRVDRWIKIVDEIMPESLEGKLGDDMRLEFSASIGRNNLELFMFVDTGLSEVTWVSTRGKNRH
ncbi:MAG: hypothetical protein KZQ93_05715 [Candidatus Thiodiazotropha sp. (ex Monitilora ramsayi)]|nr:hypothetical protein [Candidatus Thiodiazotropha sp. (ex Monitilora ramsayi)]